MVNPNPEPTFPDDVIPFQMLKMQNTQLARRHKANSHLTLPSSSMPLDMEFME